MFVQVITAPVGDAEAIKRTIDSWDEDRRPQAKGFLGATSGISAQNTFVAVARFESEDHHLRRRWTRRRRIRPGDPGPRDRQAGPAEHVR
jgi:hypothetical protein